MSKQLAAEIADTTEVTILVHRENSSIAVVEFDIGDGNSHCMILSPESLKMLAVRMFAAARAILGDQNHAEKRRN